jgi:hypothetical protein
MNNEKQNTTCDQAVSETDKGLKVRTGVTAGRPMESLSLNFT